MDERKRSSEDAKEIGKDKRPEMQNGAAGAPLDELFWDWQLEEGLPLEQFLEQVAAGKFGDRTRDEVVDFVEGVTQSIMGNIDTKASEGPTYQAMRDDVIEETRERMNALIDRYAPKK